MRHCVRYCIGELPTRCWKRSASTEREVLGDAREFVERPRVAGARVHRLEGGADDAVVHAGEPAGAAFGLFVHVEAQHLDEEHLRQLREHARAARAVGERASPSA